MRIEEFPLLLDLGFHHHADGHVGVNSAVSVELAYLHAGILTVYSTSTYGLTDGGRAGMVYVYIGSFVGFFAAVISMAEIASV